MISGTSSSSISLDKTVKADGVRPLRSALDGYCSAGAGRFEDRFHDFKDVVRQCPACPRLCARRRRGEVGDAEAAAGVNVAGRDGQGLPFVGAQRKQLDVAVEVVGIRHHQRSEFTVNLDVRRLGLYGVKAHEQGGERAGGVDQDPGDMGVDVYRDSSPWRGPEPMVRVLRVWLAAPMTDTTGPSRVTRAVT